jgi:hypothetical protein
MRLRFLIAILLGLCAAPMLADEGVYGHDPVLAGHWRFSDTMTSGGSSIVLEQHMWMRSDGSYVLSDGPVAGVGEASSPDGGDEEGLAAEGRWKTRDGVLYIQEGDAAWEAHARYGVEATTLTLRFGDGSTELWYRVDD